MRAYDFGTHNKTVKRDKSRYFSYTFIFLLVAAFAAFIYYVVLNSPRILFYFRENKYSEIEKAHGRALEAIHNLQPAAPGTAAKTSEALQLLEVSEFLDLAHTLQKDHREDPILHFHEATVLAEAVRKQANENTTALIFLLFREFINRPVFPREFDHELWQRTILTWRRARALGLPDVLSQKLAEAEIDAYDEQFAARTRGNANCLIDFLRNAVTLMRDRCLNTDATHEPPRVSATAAPRDVCSLKLLCVLFFRRTNKK